jgi:hypothetical protein
MGIAAAVTDSFVNSDPVAWLAESELDDEEEASEDEEEDEEDDEDDAEDPVIFLAFFFIFFTAAAASRPAPMASASTCFLSILVVDDSFVTLVV